MEQNAPKRDLVSTLARVLGGGFALVMLGSAVAHTAPYISSTEQAAATWIGDQIGAPEGYLGRVWPDDLDCYYNIDANFAPHRYCAAQRGWDDRAIARPVYADDDYPRDFWDTVAEFYSATLSVSPADADPTGEFETNTYEYGGLLLYRQIEMMGPPTFSGSGYSTIADCSNYSLPEKYNYLQWKGVSADPYGYGSITGWYTAVKGATTTVRAEVRCWVVGDTEEPIRGGRNPDTPGQTAFSISEYVPYVKVKKLGPAECEDDGTGNIICTPPPLPAGALPGDKVMDRDPVLAKGVTLLYAKYLSPDKYYWQMRPNPTPSGIEHESGQHTVGDIPTVEPGEDITLQWSCQPKRVVNVAKCYRNHAQDDCDGVTTGGIWNITTLFTRASGSVAGPASAPAFSTANSPSNKKTIKAPSVLGIYTYSMTCTGSNINGKILSVKLRVGHECESPSGTEIIREGTTVVGFKLPKQEARTYTVGSTTLCAFNGTNNDYFVPVKTAAEFQAFINAVTNNQVAGVSPN